MIEETLQEVRFFEFLTEEEREEFAEVSEFVSFGPGENIIEEGAEQESLFVLASGTKRLSCSAPSSMMFSPGPKETNSETSANSSRSSSVRNSKNLTS